MSTSIIIPCYNEKNAIRDTIELIRSTIENTKIEDVEIICVNDGSTDGSEHVLNALACEEGDGNLLVVHHKRNQGYGAALKTGIRRSQKDYICITDADGTYPNERIPELIEQITKNDLDMVVGARIGPNVDYSKIRSIPKMILVPWVSFLCGTDVPDMNSGLRIFRRDRSLDFLKLLPDGFSFTTTITICLLRNRYGVEFMPISYAKRVGKSHIKPVRDTLRFTQLILRTGMYFAPMRLLSPLIIALGILFIVSGTYDLAILNNLTDKTVLLGFASLNVAMFALLADMIDKRAN
ncbi:Poly-beta-1,6-N-acetyl-D-glucosamine synthase [Synechococcus sp. MIT S9509]|uniref:glycosyltransferase family 2 protein n=1 Tax=unclassified Synechococcus TaxID=2626047 RepID=UPI0007BB94C6|nr:MULTISPECIES: glycosyltransferase family 2 protein [unclassified Synechococcus]KZR85040.1 Poly-beta-1,6-N-acetyl-D-glucosamine synthase [Synechococcus sp. MIT S9504]KZR93776.1 Poly-beta-1,6-N-acetyl-D-glucosamine synthase [Synechococcus sp. MIT S9509]